jgi:protein-disulfide isomerase
VSAWRSPIALITGGALLIGIVAVLVLVVVRPGSSAPTGNGSLPQGLVPPASTTPPGLGRGREIGPANAPVTMDVWSDFQCPACGAFARQYEPRLVADFVTAAKLRIVYHDYPFIGAGRDPDESTDAAVASRCADRQGRYWDYYGYLFANQLGENVGSFTRDRLVAIAGVLGLDRSAFEACLDDSTVREAVVAEYATGRSLGIDRTPTLFVNGVKTSPVPQYDQLAAMIASLAGGSAAPSGASRSP